MTLRTNLTTGEKMPSFGAPYITTREEAGLLRPAWAGDGLGAPAKSDSGDTTDSSTTAPNAKTAVLKGLKVLVRAMVFTLLRFYGGVNWSCCSKGGGNKA
mmetsp:Transcript_27870/g.64753  ORF Transcript_27870/g.64753 Transcript_27870/m.64753 type:complete len:100 (-) Transcript_27870:8-307(-)